ncbi:VCBS domain-containing protein, partial [Candidatus Pelagibacter sp.]|nr:VCBS domain-containing protein [Candidatus Pelagibacter sp.]
MTQKPKKKQKIFIEALEQRIMLDGAGASTFLDLIDERNQEEIKKNSKIIDTTRDNNEVPFANTARDQNKKNVVFIDSAVSDYETIINSFKENTEFYLINSNEDGFKRISEILNDRKDIDGLHIIGHGSAGEILFGNAFLNNDTITNYQSTLASIGQSLTTSGDILFYGCNIASTEQGEILIKKISEITKADIAASDDLTGKGGDWVLEKKIGIIETQNFKIGGYNHDLVSWGNMSSSSNSVGISHIFGTQIETDTTPDLTKDANDNGNSSTYDWFVYREKSGLSISTNTYVSEVDIDGGNQSLSADNTTGDVSTSLRTLNQNTSLSSATVSSYYVYFTDTNKNGNPNYKTGGIVFDGEIIGVFFSSKYTLGPDNTLPNSTSNRSTAYTINDTYGDSDADYYNGTETDKDNFTGGRVFEDGSEYFDDDADISTSIDSATVSNASSGGTNNWLRVRAKNGNGGDIIRVIVKENTLPTASNSTVYINENNQASTAGDRTPSNISKIFAASDFNYSDGDSDSLSKIKITTLESAGVLEYSSNGSSWADVTLNQEITASDIGNNRLRFTPAANSESNVTFGFKVHDGTDYSSSAYTMTVSVNAAPNVTDATVGSTVSADGTSSGDVHDGVADSDDNDSVLVVTGVASGNESSNNSIVTNNTGVGSAVSGTYGSLNIASNGTYTYTASSTNNISYGSTATDIFTFTTRDDETASGSFAYDVGTITFTVASSISLVADTDAVAEDGTVTHSTNSAGTVISDDAADTNGLVVTNISHTNGNADTIESGSTYTDSSGEPGSVVGTYGTLKIGADGTYTYTADQTAADALDLNDQVTDVFTYTADGATATLTIIVTGINDNPTAVNDTGYIKEGGTLTVANSAAASSGTSTGNHTGDITDNDTDADASSTATITSITATTAGRSAQTTFSSSSETVSGSYGTLTINSNGSYSYAANSNISGLDAGDANITDVFTYIVSDGTATSTATLTINVIASQDLTARNDTGTVNEDATLTVADGDDANSITTAATSYSADDAESISVQENKAAGLAFSKDGLKMFHAGNDNDDIHEYTLTSAFDVSSASYVDSLDVSARDAEIFGITFNNDGTKLYFTGANTADAVFQYSLGTAYDISSGTYDNVSLSVVDNRPCGIRFNNDGTKLFVTGFDSQRIEEYSLSTAFDISSSSATYAGNSERLNTSSYETNPRDIEFNSDGTRLFITGGTGDDITEYELSTAFDVSTATYHGEYDTSSQDGNTFSLRFNNDGSKMFMLGYNSDKVHEYNLASPYNLIDISGEHSGDVINTSSTANYDTDPDSDTLTITSIIATTAGGSAQTTFSSNTEAVTGSYGILTINSNGSYQYAATLDATDALDAGDVVTDVFTYIVSDGQGETDTATITITVIGVNDAPSAQNDVGVIVEGGTLTVANGANANLSGSYDATGEHSGDVIDTSSSSHTDSDADASASLTVTAIRKGQESGSGDSGTVGAALTGTYGQLTIAADGSYSYAANQSAANALAAGESANDYFTYTVSDSTATDTAQITITVLGSNDAPSATADTGYIQEGKTLTVADGASANDADSSSNNNDATGDHTGDILGNDTDPDTNDTLTVTTYTHTSSAGQGGAASGANGNSGTAGTNNVAGDYGTLDLEANGSYTYTANSNITNLDVDDETFTDVFTYTLSDGTTTTTETITITIEASGDVTAQNDTGTVNEDATLTVANSENANSVTALSLVRTTSINSQESYPRDVTFNNDGTKMFTIGATGDDIGYYTLSTAYDTSTATHQADYLGGTYTTAWSLSF